MRRKRRYYKNRVPFILLSIFLCIAICFVYISNKLVPLAQDYCVNEIEFLALDAMNTAVSNDMDENSELYKDIAILNNSSDITAVTTDTYKINKIKTNIMRRSDEILNSMIVDKVEIPIGAIYNNIFFFAQGIEIPVQMIPMSTVNVDFASSFESVGINQSLHRIIMECSIDLKIIIPYETVDFKVVHKIAIAETLIIGDVPNSYTQIEDLGQSTLDKFNHYAK